MSALGRNRIPRSCPEWVASGHWLLHFSCAGSLSVKVRSELSLVQADRPELGAFPSKVAEDLLARGEE